MKAKKRRSRRFTSQAEERFSIGDDSSSRGGGGALSHSSYYTDDADTDLEMSFTKKPNASASVINKAGGGTGGGLSSIAEEVEAIDWAQMSDEELILRLASPLKVADASTNITTTNSTNTTSSTPMKLATRAIAMDPDEAVSKVELEYKQETEGEVKVDTDKHTDAYDDNDDFEAFEKELSTIDTHTHHPLQPEVTPTTESTGLISINAVKEPPEEAPAVAVAVTSSNSNVSYIEQPPVSVDHALVAGPDITSSSIVAAEQVVLVEHAHNANEPTTGDDADDQVQEIAVHLIAAEQPLTQAGQAVDTIEKHDTPTPLPAEVSPTVDSLEHAVHQAVQPTVEISESSTPLISIESTDTTTRAALTTDTPALPTSLVPTPTPVPSASNESTTDLHDLFRTLAETPTPHHDTSHTTPAISTTTAKPISPPSPAPWEVDDLGELTDLNLTSTPTDITHTNTTAATTTAATTANINTSEAPAESKQHHTANSVDIDDLDELERFLESLNVT